MAAVRAGLARHGLAPVGAFHPGAEDGAPAGVATLVLVGAAGREMWRHFRASPEFADGRPNPLDRWSVRVIGATATSLGAEALFPFSGPPWPPFHCWAAPAEGARASPVGMLVSPTRGLWLSYRGALAFRERLALAPPPARDPCAGCARPCLAACPVNAFAGGSYDVARCIAHVASRAGRACREGGCRVRDVCPAGAGARPPRAQRGFHMRAFLTSQRCR